MKISELRLPSNRAGGAIVWLSIYIATFLLLRLAISPTVGVDDVEQAVLAQSWAPGYTPDQPPIYTWLVFATFKLFGVDLFSLTLLRYVLLFLTYLFLYLSAVRLYRDRSLAALAAFSAIFIYYVGWGAHLGFTHTALLAALCSATFYALLRLVDTGSWKAYAALGTVVGLGFDAKYSYVLLVAGLAPACLLQPLPRRRLLHPRMLLSLFIATVLVVPPLVWLAVKSGSLAAFLTYYSHQEFPYHGAVPRSVLGIWRTLLASAGFLFPWWLIVPPMFPQALRPLPAGPAGEFDAGRLLGHSLLFTYAALTAGALAGKLIYISTRWMHPVLLLLPLYYFYRVNRFGATPVQRRRFTIWLRSAAIVTAFLFLIQGRVGPLLCGKCRWFEPYPELADQVAAAGFEGGTIVAADEHIAGNFRMRFPGARVIALPYSAYIPPPNRVAGQCLLVWDPKAEGEAIPADLLELLRSRLGYVPGATARVGLVRAANHALHDRPLALAYALLPAGGDCR